MQRITFYIFSCTLIYLIFSLTSCVAKKKFLTEVELRQNCDSTLQLVNSRNLELNKEIAQLKLSLAEKTGERNAFRELIDKQDEQLNRLEDEINSLTSQTLDQQSLMDGVLGRKEQEINRQKELIQSFKDVVTEDERNLQTIVARIAENLPEQIGEGLTLESKNGNTYILLSEQLIFRKGTTRLNSKAFDILEAIGNVLMDFPAMEILVVGHTDNQPGKTNNWNLSTLRATAVVKALIDDVGMAPNQILAAGKGEFKPITSNETSEGRAANRRTEIVIRNSPRKLVDKVKNSQ